MDSESKEKLVTGILLVVLVVLGLCLYFHLQASTDDLRCVRIGNETVEIQGQNISEGVVCSWALETGKIMGY